MKKRFRVAAILAALATVIPLTALPAAAAYPVCDERKIVFVGNIGTEFPAHDGSESCRLAMGSGNYGYWGTEALQTTLDYCYGLSIAIDGVFGPKTAAALELAQRIEGAAIDGKYGPESRRLLKWRYQLTYTSMGETYSCKRL